MELNIYRRDDFPIPSFRYILQWCNDHRAIVIYSPTNIRKTNIMKNLKTHKQQQQNIK